MPLKLNTNAVRPKRIIPGPLATLEAPPAGDNSITSLNTNGVKQTTAVIIASGINMTLYQTGNFLFSSGKAYRKLNTVKANQTAKNITRRRSQRMVTLDCDL
ncbi:MAG: hypothetical protein A2117_02610 [Candidatus Wildermuthbacteria bacterium GWA2_46_15]|uniref:Uncharacterized protein n=1 Tax=Candidatus Wildermuthbacteria bacterium GWA2_46_15 TaxID=1802443 RepID=A0A1G2QS69_9BACT|nr:MAG: hypothetical protein A2117_02610 [Candidatus Wildermuthbacteria bacterium GWA2_46_15]